MQTAADRPQAGPSDHVVVVLGHRLNTPPMVHVISGQSVRRVRRAESVAASAATRAVILSGWATVGASEARQMAALWRLPDTPIVLEEKAQNTAENAAESLELILAMGGVRKVTVVTSAWHLRTPYFFRHYRQHGIAVQYRFAPVKAHEWPGFLLYELRALRHLRSMRRAAYERTGHDVCRAREGV